MLIFSTLHLAQVECPQTINFSNCSSLENIDLKDINCQSIVFPQSIGKIALKNISTFDQLELDSFVNLTTIEILNLTIKSLSLPISLKELVLKQCANLTFDPKILSKLPNLKRFVSLDLNLTSTEFPDDLALIDVAHL